MDINKLKGHVPDGVIGQIPSVMSTFKIDSALRLSHFLAQCGHESAGFKAIQENLNYEIGSAMALKIVRSNMLEFPDFKELVHKSHHMVVETYQMQQDPNFTYIRFKCPRLCRFAEIVTSQNKSFLVAVDIQTPVDAVIRIGSFWLENHTIKKIILHN